MNDLWRSIAHTSAAKVCALGLSVAFLGLTARWLGPEGRGQFATIMAWTTLLGWVGNMSLGQVSLHRASTRQNDRRFGETLGTLMVLAVLLSLATWAAAAAVYFLTKGTVLRGMPLWPQALALLGLPFFMWEHYGSSLLISQERTNIYNRSTILGRSLSLLALAAFISWWSLGVAGAVGAAILGQVVIALGGIRFLLNRAEGTIQPTRSEMGELLKGGSRLHLNTISSFVFGSIDVLIINWYRGAEEAGFYQLAAQLIGVMLILPNSASMVLYGRIVSLGPDGAWPYHRRVVLYTVGLAALGALLAAALAPILVTLVAGAKFAPSASIFRWLLWATLGMTFSTVMAPQWISRGYFLPATSVTLSIGVATSIANLVLVPDYGMLGAAWAAIGGTALSAVCNVGMVLFCNRRGNQAVSVQS